MSANLHPSSFILHPSPFFPGLAGYIETSIDDFPVISAERRHVLDQIAAYIDACRREDREARLIFICTHNSRRSIMAHIWAETGAVWYGVSGVRAFSGGAQVTAFNSHAVRALMRAGFRIEARGDGPNPVYETKWGPDAPPIEVFSKLYHDPANPQQDFCAVMTCSDADRACPVIPGAVARFAVPFRDPGMYDGAPDEIRRYDERCRQISCEMLYVFSRL